MDDFNLGRFLRPSRRVYRLVRQIDRRNGRGKLMTIVLIFTGALFIYLVYALLHPDKF
ncbi:K(+)-transporting ATPase subunit F [Cohnella sp. LGH]|nr:K(+)-transporting ATPase subunit F [Cohnella sp. LGH]